MTAQEANALSVLNDESLKEKKERFGNCTGK